MTGKLHPHPPHDPTAAATCQRKSYFPSKAQAKNKAAIIARGGDRLRAYECSQCGGWHLTSMTAEVERAARAERARGDE